MEKMWAGRAEKATDQLADDFNSSIRFDSRMYKEDIEGSLAHAAMLCACGILTEEECASITEGLGGIRSDLETGKLPFDETAEDIHMFVESELTRRIGDNGKKLHTARSRNDQVALDLRLYLRKECGSIREKLLTLLSSVTDRAEECKEMILPGYTHLQRAQPITFGQHLLAYSMMLLRDLGRLQDTLKRMNYSPLGSCALAGTTYRTDRRMVAKALCFDGICENSLDGVSDRDYCLELLSCLSILMMHLSRFSEEIILWSSWEFKFVELDDAYTTGSSIMPQKKNSDMAELVRGKTGRVYGDLMGSLTMLKGLPLAYNKDMQEDKESVFDAVDTVKMCLEIFAPMIATMKPLPENMYKAAGKGYINATDLADYLTKKGLPFRTAYKIVGQTVGYCIRQSKTLEELSLEEYRTFYEGYDRGLFDAISLKNCVSRRTSEGGTALPSVEKQIGFVREQMKQFQ